MNTGSVARIHCGPSCCARMARTRSNGSRPSADLLDRYGFAIRRYLQAGLRDETAVDEVFQEFALAFVRGDTRGSRPTAAGFAVF